MLQLVSNEYRSVCSSESYTTHNYLKPHSDQYALSNYEHNMGSPTAIQNDPVFAF